MSEKESIEIKLVDDNEDENDSFWCCIIGGGKTTD